jgi:tetratricopeptide (TPR) repeat protein
MRHGFLAFLVLLLSASAWAQAPDLDRARRHFEAGSKAFQTGDYPRAELEFRGAYAITKDPLLFYNIGQSQQRRGHLEEAIKSYRAYLAGVPDADDRAEVEGLIRAAEKELAAPKAGGGGTVTGPVEKPTSAPTPRSDDDNRTRRRAAWIVGSVSMAMLAVGASMSGLSWKKAVDANKMINRRDVSGQPVPFVDVQGAFNSRKSDAATFGGVAIGMYAAAAVGAGITTYLFITSRSGKASKEKREARLRLVPVLDPRNAGLVAGMEF